jgi:hypothetical protein
MTCPNTLAAGCQIGAQFGRVKLGSHWGALNSFLGRSELVSFLVQSGLKGLLDGTGLLDTIGSMSLCAGWVTVDILEKVSRNM